MANDDLRARLVEALERCRVLTPDAQADAVLTLVRDIAVPLRDELARLQAGLALNDDAWGSVWLHGKWSWLTKNMTTPEREHAADCVARWSARLEPDEPGEPEGLRWWRDPERCCVCGSTAVGYHNYREQPFCWPCADGNPPTTKENLS